MYCPPSVLEKEGQVHDSIVCCPETRCMGGMRETPDSRVILQSKRGALRPVLTLYRRRSDQREKREYSDRLRTHRMTVGTGYVPEGIKMDEE